MMSIVEDHKEAIKKAMKKLCGLLPKAIEGQCKSIVDTYLIIIINMLTKGATPEIICQKIGLCDKTAGVPIIKHQD